MAIIRRGRDDEYDPLLADEEGPAEDFGVGGGGSDDGSNYRPAGLPVASVNVARSCKRGSLSGEAYSAFNPPG